MKAVVRSIISPDADLPSFVPADPRRVGLFVQVLFGPADGPGEESHAVESEQAPTWLELGQRLSRIGRWEFEDYTE